MNAKEKTTLSGLVAEWIYSSDSNRHQIDIGRELERAFPVIAKPLAELRPVWATRNVAVLIGSAVRYQHELTRRFNFDEHTAHTSELYDIVETWDFWESDNGSEALIALERRMIDAFQVSDLVPIVSELFATEQWHDSVANTHPRGSEAFEYLTTLHTA